jgi:hypothetical protein
MNGDFYFVDYLQKRGGIELELLDSVENTAAFLRGEDRKNIPLRLRYYRGKHASDILPLGRIGLWGYSPRMVEKIKKASATGIEFFPLNVEGPETIVKPLQNYCGAFIVGTSGPVLKEKSIYKCVPVKRNPEKNIFWQIGLFFDLQTWGGADFFNPQKTLFTFVSSRIVKFLSEIKMLSVGFTSTDDFENIIPVSMIPDGVQIQYDDQI